MTEAFKTTMRRSDTTAVRGRVNDGPTAALVCWMLQVKWIIESATICKSSNGAAVIVVAGPLVIAARILMADLFLESDQRLIRREKRRPLHWRRDVARAVE